MIPDTNSRTIRKNKILLINTALMTSLFVVAFVQSSLSLANDTEIYFSEAPSFEDSVNTIMFMFDTSGSMNASDGLGIRRLDRLKSAMYDVLIAAENVNVGIGSFSGREQGGSIRYPSIYLDEDQCASAACTSLSVRTDVQRDEDDGVAIRDGGNEYVELNADSLPLGTYSSSDDDNQTI